MTDRLAANQTCMYTERARVKARVRETRTEEGGRQVRGNDQEGLRSGNYFLEWWESHSDESNILSSVSLKNFASAYITLHKRSHCRFPVEVQTESVSWTALKAGKITVGFGAYQGSGDGWGHISERRQAQSGSTVFCACSLLELFDSI